MKTILSFFLALFVMAYFAAASEACFRGRAKVFQSTKTHSVVKVKTVQATGCPGGVCKLK